MISASKLGQIALGKESAIATLVEMIQSDETSGDEVLKAAESLGEIDPGNQTAIASIVEELQTTEHEYLRWVLATSLGRIDPGNQTAINTLLQLIETTKKYCCCVEFLNTPSDLEGMDEEGFCYLENRCHLAARSLGEIDPGNQTAMTTLVSLIDTNQDEHILYEETRCQAAVSLGMIDPGNEKAIATLVELIQANDDEDIFSQALTSLEVIGKGNEKAIAALEKLIQTEYYDHSVAESLGIIDPGNETAIIALVELILDGADEDEIVADSLERILQGNQYPKVVAALKHYMTERVLKDNIYFYTACHDVIWRCAENMSYPDFYRAWHGEPSSVQHSENPIADIASQLQPTDKTYPLVINTQALEGEIDTSVISQEICNQFYLIAFPNNSEIPEVNNAPQLKRVITQIKKQLQKPNLALIINNCEPNQELTAFYRKITDVLHIAWITNEPLKPPLRAFPPEQPNLISAIQAWIDEIG